MAFYVELTKTEFESALPGQFTVKDDDPRTQEYVYRLPTPAKDVSVVVFSSVGIGADITRGVGEDAIRVVFWDDRNHHPVGKGKRIYRVTSKESVAERIAKTVNEFVAKSNTVSVMDWDYVHAVLKSSKGEFAQSLLAQLNTRKSLSATQLAYVVGTTNPKGYATMEGNLKSYGWKYNPEFIEEEVSEPAPFLEAKPNLNDVITDTSDMQLVSTEGYPYKFSQFNAVQSLVHPLRELDCNIIVGAATSSGKTIAAELVMEEVLKRGDRVIYMSPLKSLTQEKYGDWKERFPQYSITILTGDYTLSEEKKRELAGSPIIVMTSEMVDSRTRRMEAEKNYWLMQVGLLIVDESHILTTSRGHAVESGIMRFTSVNQKAQVLFLSATMPNVADLGKWLTTLNSKETKVIYSTWRPVELKINYVEYNPSRSYSAEMSEKKQIALEIIQSKPQEKFLVFTHDKNTGRHMVTLLKELGIHSMFHNADLDLAERLETEQSFANRTGGIRVLVSTSTLAWGRNLPARNVIIIGVHRGLNEVDELDIIQMAGRAGRFGIDPQGDVYLIIPQGSAADWAETFRNPRPVESVMKDHQILAFHVLAEIQNKVIRDARSLLTWYSRSLAFFQKKAFTLEDAQVLLDDLEKMEMITQAALGYSLTGLGKTSSWLYYSPYDIYAWYTNFKKIFETNKVDDLTLGWAIGDIPSNNWGYIPKDTANEVEDMRWQLRNRGITASDAVHFGLAAHKCLTGAEVTGALAASARTIKYDIRRITEALILIDDMHARWMKKDFWHTLALRITYGIPEEMAGLVKLPGIGGVRARKMWDAGIKTVQDVAEETGKLEELFGEVFTTKLQKAAEGILHA